MSIVNIDLGTTPNDKTGTPLRDGGSIINDNTQILYNLSNKIEQGKVLIFKDTDNSSIESIEQNDIIIGLIEEGSVKYLIRSKYNTGSVSDYGTVAGLFNDGSYYNLGYDVISGSLQTYLPLLQGYLPLIGGTITGSLTVTEGINVDILDAGEITSAGDITANNFIGNGSQLTNLPLSNYMTLNTGQTVGSIKTFSENQIFDVGIQFSPSSSGTILNTKAGVFQNSNGNLQFYNGSDTTAKNWVFSDSLINETIKTYTLPKTSGVLKIGEYIGEVIKNKPFIYPSQWVNEKIPLFIKNGKAEHDYDIDNLFDLSTYTPYYVSPTGNDANDGLTPSTPKESVRECILSGADLIYMEEGVYYRDTFTGQRTLSGNDLIVIGSGRKTYVTGGQKGLSWTLTTNNTYTTVRTNTIKVMDSTIIDEFGMLTTLKYVTSQALCEAEAGTYYEDGTNVYVHTIDERVPDDTIIVDVTISNTITGDSGRLFYKDLTYLAEALGVEGLTSASTLELYLKNVNFSKNEKDTNNLNCKSVQKTILQGCNTFGSFLDGFNYHDYQGVSDPFVVEIDCGGFNPGFDSDQSSSQCSTSHEAINILRINCSYYGANPQVVADVNDVYSILVGCELNAEGDYSEEIVRIVDGVIDSCTLSGNKIIKQTGVQGLTITNSVIGYSELDGDITIN